MPMVTTPNAGIPYAFRRRAPNGDEKLTAAGILFHTPDGRALFTRRSGTADHGGEWAFPGGVVEQDEEPSDAARREAIEEIGRLPAWEIDGLHRATDAAGVDFVTFHQQGDAFIPQLNHEHDDYLWAPIDAPPQPLHPAVASMLAAHFQEEAEEPEHGWETEQLAREFFEESREPGADADMSRIKSVKIKFDNDEAQDQKIIQRIAHYGLSRDGVDRCEVCIFYRPLGPHVAGCREGETLEEACEHSVADGPHCTLVEDPIIPNGWCRFFKFPRETEADKHAPVEDTGVHEPLIEGEDVGMERIKSLKIKFENDELPPDIVLDEALALDQEGSVREFDPDGRMRVAKAHISKANICPYKGAEIPGAEEMGLQPDQIYMLYRDPEELEKAAPSFNGVQLLRRHVPVDAEDHRAWDIIGTTGTECEFNDPYLDNALVIWAKDSIDDIESERKKELSAGYHYRADMTPGEIDGKPFDGVMRDIVGNHVALVETGRAGSDVVVGDSMESLMAHGPFATFAEALIRYQLPPTKPGAKLDLMPVLKTLTGKTTDKRKVRLALDTAVKGKLAKDANLESITGMLDHLAKSESAKSQDESVSGAQHRAMAAAAGGSSNLGIPKNVGQEFMDKDKGKTFSDADPSENLGAFLKSKGMSEDDVRTACDIMRRGHDAEAVEESVGSVNPTPGSPTGEGAKATEKASVGGKDADPDQFAETKADLVDKAQEKKTGEDAMPKDMVTKQAMDAAIKAATEAVRANVLKSQREIRMALDEVRPFVGELSPALAFDTADDVYREALKVKDPELDLKPIHPSAFRHILTKAYSPAGAREPSRANGTGLGMDEASKQSFNERFPNAARIGVA